MGVDFLLYCVVIDAAKAPDWKRGRQVIVGLTDDEAFELAYLIGADEGPREQAATRVREELLRSLSMLKEAMAGLEHRRDIDRIGVRGAHVYATGGLSGGDPPTELAEAISLLQETDALAAAGFELG